LETPERKIASESVKGFWGVTLIIFASLQAALFGVVALFLVFMYLGYHLEERPWYDPEREAWWKGILFILTTTAQGIPGAITVLAMLIPTFPRRGMMLRLGTAGVIAETILWSWWVSRG
jgi:hypothetical protein